jgi:acyl dehydratase
VVDAQWLVLLVRRGSDSSHRPEAPTEECGDVIRAERSTRARRVSTPPPLVEVLTHEQHSRKEWMLVHVMAALFYEDYSTGTVVRTDRRTVTDDDAHAFLALLKLDARLFADPTNTNAPMGGARVVPGSLVYLIGEGLLIGCGVLKDVGIALLGITELRVLAPVHVGDTVELTARLLDKRLSNSRPGSGVVTTHHRMTNQVGADVLQFDAARLIRCRPES